MDFPTRITVQLKLVVGHEDAYIRVGDALWIHATSESRVPANAAFPFDVTVEVASQDGRMACTGVTVRQATGGPQVTKNSLRSLPLRDYMMQAAAATAFRIEEGGDPATSRAVFAGGDLFMDRPDDVLSRLVAKPGPRAAGRRPISDDELKDVAATYRAALALGLPPTRHVAETMHVSRSHAGRLVVRARKKGFLGRTRPGAGGEEVD